MKETEKRIEAYKKALPEIREKVLAVALLLVMSIAMMTSATFAWLTISRAPEVTEVATTVAANGNLEIALATSETAPGESKVGDSSATEGQTIVNANKTWGNLINLSDSSYGLENLALRPAQLNTASLLKSPLYGAEYAGDGRITQLDSTFGYTTWVGPSENDPTGHFEVSEDFGVRAITSMRIEAIGAEALYVKMVKEAENANLAAAGTYAALGSSEKYMPSLATMMGLYMTARMNPSDEKLSNPDISIEDVQNLRDMYAAFLGCFDLEAGAIAKLVNLQLFLKHGEGNYGVYTAEKIYESTTAKLKAEGIQISDFDQFIKDRNTIASDLEKLKTICSSGKSLKWSDSGINSIVNNLVDVGKCTIGADNTPISSIGASNAMGYLSGTQEARITNGILYRFEERTGGYIEVKNMGISATVKRSGITVPATVRANIQTTAPRDYNLFTNDFTYAKSLNTGDYKGGVEVAEDTYGLAVDLWVRTNAENSYLVLEGNVLLSDPVEQDVYGKDANGNQVPLYSVTISTNDGEGGTISSELTVYKVVTGEGENEVTKWYNSETHAEVTEDELGGAIPLPKKEEVRMVIGYEGENRIWGDNELLTPDSTTQGSGSCYVYYADTPEDQARSLKLLEAFNVAFVSDDGKLLAKAVMDTENYYAANGRVTVPLVLDTSSSVDLGEDSQGNREYAITVLEKNVPTMITAIVYLDGTKLTNQEVLAASEIQGQLNIQFGSSESKMNPITNEELESKERIVSAQITGETSFDYDTYTGPMKTTVKVMVDGDEPSSVTAFFMRAVSETQGSREGTMTFTKDSEGNWTSDYTFTAPGKYVLRTVRLDGVDYDLNQESLPTVTVTGFAVNSFRCTQADNNHINIMTADASSTVDFVLQFAADDTSKMPSTVQGRFIKDEDGSAVNIDFTYNPTNKTWNGSATFLTSGDYRMQYIVLDGKYTELNQAFWHTASVTLGMKVEVYTTSPHLIIDDGEELPANEMLLGMQVKIIDNEGDEQPGLTGARLTYRMKGGSITDTMDTDLTWTGKYYEGELQNLLMPGVWQFSNVTVGSNVLSVATTAPQFTIRSVSPSNFYTENTIEYQYKPNPKTDPAIMNAHITNSAGLSRDEEQESLVKALIIKEGQMPEQGIWVDGTFGSQYEIGEKRYAGIWNFVVPQDANGYQDGNWQMIKLSLGEVYDSEGNYYTEENPRIIDITEEENKATVVSRINVVFKNNKSQNFGQDENGNITAQFMDSHEIEDLEVDITDYNGNVLHEGVKVTDVKLTFAYQSGSSATYGKYTSDDLTNAIEGATVTVTLTDTDDDGKFTQTNTDGSGNTIIPTLVYAGFYNTTLSFKVNETEYKYAGTTDNAGAGTKALPENAPVFTVWSKAPTVKVSAISPASGTYSIYTAKNPSTQGQMITSSELFSKTAYTANVYLYVGDKYLTINIPTVTLALSEIPAGYSNATMVFETKNSDSVGSTFNFGSGTTATASIGNRMNGSSSWSGDTYPKLYPAGKMTQGTLTLDYGGMPYTITLERAITIDQPISPVVVDFAGVPDSYVTEEREKPAQIIGAGSTATITLPKLVWTETIEEAADTTATWSAYTAVETIADGKVYGYKEYETSEWFGIKKTKHKDYQYYEWTKFQSTYTGKVNIYEQENVIESWIINDKEYEAGTAILLSGEGRMEATAVVTKGKKEPVKEETRTSYKYLYGYKKGEEVKDEELFGYFGHTPSGDMIGNVVYSQNGTYPTVAIAVPASANANTNTIGTNMTDNSGDYRRFWP